MLIGWSLNSSIKDRPNGRRPVPASMMIISPPARTSMHEVLPPNSTVLWPGVGMEPRTPQNFNRAGVTGSDVEDVGLLPEWPVELVSRESTAMSCGGAMGLV